MSFALAKLLFIWSDSEIGIKDQNFVIGFHIKTLAGSLMWWQRTRPLHEAITLAVFDRKLKTLLGAPEDCWWLGKEYNSTLLVTYFWLISSGWMNKHVSSFSNKFWVFFVLKTVSSENLENGLQVDLNLQMPLRHFHIVEKNGEIEIRTSGRRWKGWKIKKE
jgi:hypothetical protein